MARIRTVKPEFWTDGQMVRLSIAARLFYIGTWNFALCDNGHLPDDAMSLKLKILPADPVDADELLEELLTSGRILRKITGEGRPYLHIVRLSDHQKTDARWQSRCPFCLAEATPPSGEYGQGASSEGGGATPPGTLVNHGWGSAASTPPVVARATSPDHARLPEDSHVNADTPANSESLTETRASLAEPHPGSVLDSKGKESKGSTKNSPPPASPPGDSDPPPPANDDETPSGQLPGMPQPPIVEKPPEPGSDDDRDFVEFWSVFPLKADKAAARKAWANAVKKVAPFVIVAGAKRYRDQVAREHRKKQHIKYPGGWLNGERWNDEIPEQAASGSEVPDRNAYDKDKVI